MYKKFHQEQVRHLLNRAAFDSSPANVAKWLHLVLLSHSMNVCDKVQFSYFIKKKKYIKPSCGSSAAKITSRLTHSQHEHQICKGKLIPLLRFVCK